MPDRAPVPDLSPAQGAPQALVEVLDRRLDTDVVLAGQLIPSVAGVDLVHVGPRALPASVDRAATLISVPGALP